MRTFLTNMKPTCFEDIIAAISLYRPGPMESIPRYIQGKQNPSSIHYETEKLRPILDVTYGCMVYQEQVMQIVRDLAGYSYGRSDLVRRAMAKKKHKVMAQEREYFIHGKLNDDGTIDVPGCVRNGVPEEVASHLYDGVAQALSSRAVYGGNSQQRIRQSGENRGIHSVLPFARHCDSAAGREPFAVEIHCRESPGRTAGDSLRFRRGQDGRAGRCGRDYP